ncbi:hypothetical protein BV25DRAFT_959888 [Artomyces pyxidatus]|uniref:Uncharacterized protein n=1 Tax=Artomyces pyxidatus TaxID=48021 RepID=A0ACB8SWT4_9AGAM|nr:hypothetical protein BV25DRAFT_959888 [Artomyces pyxidatus]
MHIIIIPWPCEREQQRSWRVCPVPMANHLIHSSMILNTDALRRHAVRRLSRKSTWSGLMPVEIKSLVRCQKARVGRRVGDRMTDDGRRRELEGRADAASSGASSRGKLTFTRPILGFRCILNPPCTCAPVYAILSFLTLLKPPWGVVMRQRRFWTHRHDVARSAIDVYRLWLFAVVNLSNSDSRKGSSAWGGEFDAEAVSDGV